MFYKRNIFTDLFDHACRKQVSIITGMRRTGKTTLVKQLLSECFSENKIFIDLERLDNRSLFNETNYNNIIEALKQRGLDFTKKVVIAIDEAQLSPNLPSVVKYLYDNFDIKFILSGSSSFYLKNLFSESLAGRKKIFELFPLTFGEFLTFRSIPWIDTFNNEHTFNYLEYDRLKPFYDEYIEFGGFPEVVLAGKINEKTDLLEDIISSYISIDIKWLSDFKNAENIRNLIMMLASRVGSKSDVSKISNLTGLSKPTVSNYIELFEQTYFIRQLNVISRNPDREIVKAKKIYFSDTGILNRLAKNSSGVIFENAVFNQLQHKGKLNYYSLKNGNEIDLILNESISYEIKETATKSDFDKLVHLSQNLNIEKCNIISRYPSKTYEKSIWGGCIR